MKSALSAAFTAMETSVTANNDPGRRRPTASCRRTLSQTMGSKPGASAAITGRARTATAASWPKTAKYSPNATSRPPANRATSVARSNADRTSSRISSWATASHRPSPARLSPRPYAIATRLPRPVTMPTHMVRNWL
ncbi:hypothetical protein D3C87_1816010 [compost metagenome]